VTFHLNLIRQPESFTNALSYSRSRARYGDFFLLMLGLTISGYAIIGKPFAYIGVPPIFISEFVLMMGLIALMRTKALAAALSTPAAIFLAALICWGIFRTVPYISIYGVDALRDSVTFFYGLIAFVLIALLLQDTRRLNDLIAFYARFAVLMPPIMTVYAIAALAWRDSLPEIPSLGVPILSLRLGDLGVHLAGAAAFTLLGFRRAGIIWTLFLLTAMGIVATQSRGAMLAMVVPLALVIIGARKFSIPVVLMIGLGVAAAYAADFETPISGQGKRFVGARQLVDNAASIFESSNENLDGTKRWRIVWWQNIQDYIFHGDYFWTGKGFGINLAESDVLIGEDPERPHLRSPHNIHLTILARAGVPGMLLWLTAIASWFTMIISSMLCARHAGEERWFALFFFVASYLLSALIDASFDVALEGPMLGFWFWSLFGCGIASAMIYRARPVVTHQEIPSE
jgi:hypothetical protein